MKQVPLPSGQFVTVDNEDYEYLRHFSWKQTSEGHVYHPVNAAGKRLYLYMHSMIMEPCEPFWVVHKDGDPLNCRKDNLVLCTPKDAAAMRKTFYTDGIRKRKERRNKSGYVGVFPTRHGRWCARITKNGVYHHLGHFTTKEAAAVAYNRAVLTMFPKGKHYLNEVPFTDDGMFSEMFLA